ncbi:MAG: DUF3793 family protein [Stomatobaculum sp.]
MSDLFIVEHCSPTLAGLKTGSLFAAPYRNRAEIDREIRALNAVLTHKRLRAVAVRHAEKFVLIYLYRPDYLKRDLEQSEAEGILRGLGYSCGSISRCVAELGRQLRVREQFPHEIGLFLGYPPEDVRGFMQSPHQGYKCIGYWKVYGDAERAQRTFRVYRHCTKVYAERIRRGSSLEQLIVQTDRRKGEARSGDR